MATARQSKEPASELATFDFISIKDLRESPTNPRKEFGDLEDLAASIAAQGLLQPLLVRKLAGSKTEWEIVCGTRRFRAAKKVGLDLVPAVMSDLSDAEVIEAQISENAQRLDPHPMEEAEAFGRLVKDHRLPVEEVAAKVGKTASFVYQRLKLLDLTPDARRAFKEKGLPIAVALQIARLPSKALQGEAVKVLSSVSGWTQEQVVREIQRRFMLWLSSAPFAVADDKLVPEAGSCSKCPKRTGNQRELFTDASIEDKDLCTDDACFRKKSEAAWALARAESEGAGHEILPDAEGKKLYPHGGYLTTSGYVEVSATCFSDPKGRTWAQLAKKSGIKTYVVRDPAGGIHRLYARKDAEEAARAAGVKLGPATGQQQEIGGSPQRARENVKAKRAAIEAAMRAARAKLASDFPREILRIILRAALGFSAVEGAEKLAELSGRKERGGKAVDWLRKEVDAMRDGDLRVALLEVVLGRSGVRSLGTGGYMPVAREIAAAVKVDLRAEEKKARQAETKSDGGEKTPRKARGRKA